jgi:hypothetical protein
MNKIGILISNDNKYTAYYLKPYYHYLNFENIHWIIQNKNPDNKIRISSQWQEKGVTKRSPRKQVPIVNRNTDCFYILVFDHRHEQNYGILLDDWIS